MNSIYIGDRPLDPPEDEECDWCDGDLVMLDDHGDEQPCICQSHLQDPGEPNEEPDL